MKNSDEKVNTGAFHNVKKVLFRGEGLTHLYMNNNSNESSNVMYQYIVSDDYDDTIYTLLLIPGVLLGILGGDVQPGSPNPDPISDQKMSFSTPVFRPDL